MSFMINIHDADQINVNRLWDLQANRTNHLKNLQTIYKQKETVRDKSFKQHLNRQRQIQKFQMSKLKNFNSRNKSFQDKINYQNSILRNKILGVYENKNNIKKAKSVFFKDAQRLSPYKVHQAQQMYKTNLRIGERLSNIKSQIGMINNIEKHAKKAQILLQMVQKKSPKKKAYLKTLTKGKIFNDIHIQQVGKDI